MKSWQKTIAAVVALLLVLAIWWLVHPTGRFGVSLVLGWGAYLARVAPRVRLDGQGLAVFVGALAALVGIVHWLLGWLYGEMRKDSAETPPVWRFRWTASIVGVLLLMFTAGISMVGVTHQIGWLASSPRPMFEPRVYLWETTSKQNLRLIGSGFSFHADNLGMLPSRDGNDARRDSSDRPQSWITQILPYMMISTEGLDRGREWDDPVNKPFFHGIVPALINPELPTDKARDAAGYGLSHYAGNPYLLDGEHALHLSDVEDGAAHTILVGEVNSDFEPWGRPGNCRNLALGIGKPDGFGGPPERGGALFLMADGSTRFVSAHTSPSVLRALATPAGGERTTSDSSTP